MLPESFPPECLVTSKHFFFNFTKVFPGVFFSFEFFLTALLLCAVWSFDYFLFLLYTFLSLCSLTTIIICLTDSTLKPMPVFKIIAFSAAIAFSPAENPTSGKEYLFKPLGFFFLLFSFNLLLHFFRHSFEYLRVGVVFKVFFPAVFFIYF